MIQGSLSRVRYRLMDENGDAHNATRRSPCRSLICAGWSKGISLPTSPFSSIGNQVLAPSNPATWSLHYLCNARNDLHRRHAEMKGRWPTRRWHARSSRPWGSIRRDAGRGQPFASVRADCMRSALQPASSMPSAPVHHTIRTPRSTDRGRQRDLPRALAPFVAGRGRAMFSPAGCARVCELG